MKVRREKHAGVLAINSLLGGLLGSLLGGLLGGLMLGGCGTLNRGVDTIKQPVVSRTDYIFDAQATNAGLAPGEADRVNGWLGGLPAS